MAKSVATLGVSVTARTSKFVKGMRRASKSLKKFAASMVRVAANVAKFAAALTTAAGVAMAFFIKHSFKTLDALAKTSQRLGIAIDDLKGLQRAIQLTGGSVEGLQKSLLLMIKNVGDVAGGTGEAKEALGKLGLNAKELIRLSPDKMLFRIGDALRRIPKGTERLFTVMEVFGARGAKEILNLLALSTTEIRAMIRESVRLSGSFSHLDLSLIQRANDAFQDMRQALRGIVDRLAIFLAPSLEAFAKRLTETFINFRVRLVTDILPAIGRFVISALNLVDRAFRQTKLKLTELAKFAARMATDILGAIPFTKVPERLARLNKALRRSVGLQRVGLRTLGTERGPAALGDRAAAAIARITAQANKAILRSAIRDLLGPIVNTFARFLKPFAGPGDTARSAAKAAAATVAQVLGARRPAGRGGTGALGRTFIPGLAGGGKKTQETFDRKAWAQNIRRNQLLERIARGALPAVLVP